MTSDKAPTPTDADRYTRMTRLEILTDQCDSALSLERSGRTTKTLVKRSKRAVTGLLPKRRGHRHTVESAEVVIAETAHVAPVDVVSLSAMTWGDKPGADLGRLNDQVNAWGIDVAVATLAAQEALSPMVNRHFESARRDGARGHLLEELAIAAHRLVAHRVVGLGQRGELEDLLRALPVDDLVLALETRMAPKEPIPADVLNAALQEATQFIADHRARLQGYLRRLGIQHPMDIDEVLQRAAIKLGHAVSRSREALTTSYLWFVVRSTALDQAAEKKAQADALRRGASAVPGSGSGRRALMPLHELDALRDASTMAAETSVSHARVHSWVAQQVGDIIRDAERRGEPAVRANGKTLIHNLYKNAGRALGRTSTKGTVDEAIGELVIALRRIHEDRG